MSIAFSPNENSYLVLLPSILEDQNTLVGLVLWLWLYRLETNSIQRWFKQETFGGGHSSVYVSNAIRLFFLWWITPYWLKLQQALYALMMHQRFGMMLQIGLSRGYYLHFSTISWSSVLETRKYTFDCLLYKALIPYFEFEKCSSWIWIPEE